MDALINYRILPQQKRTIFLKDIMGDKIYKFNLNIPQMLVGYNLSRTYYFPVKIVQSDPKFIKFDQYYSPFSNTYAEGHICLGQPLLGSLNNTINLIYNSLWKYEPSCGSFGCYVDVSNVVSHLHGQDKYIEFLKQWERTGQLKLNYRTSFTFLK